MDKIAYMEISTALSTSHKPVARQILVNDKVTKTLSRLSNTNKLVLMNNFTKISTKNISKVKPSTLILQLHDSILSLTAIQSTNSNSTKITKAEIYSTSKVYPLGMSREDAKRLDNCVADTTCVGINYTRIDNGKNINLIHSKHKSMTFRKLDSINPNQWKHIESILGQGESVEVNAGNQNIIGIKGSASPLPTQASPVLIDSFPYDRNHKQLITKKTKTNSSQGYIAPLTGAIKDEEFYIFTATVPHLYGQKWVVSIPRHQSAHGNTSGYTVRVLVKKDEH